MITFNIKRVDGGGGGGGGKEGKVSEADADAQGILAWGDDKGEIHLVTQHVLMESCRRGAYLTPAITFVDMHLSDHVQLLILSFCSFPPVIYVT